MEHQPTSTTHQLSWWAHLPDVIEQEKDVFQIQRFEANQQLPIYIRRFFFLMKLQTKINH